MDGKPVSSLTQEDIRRLINSPVEVRLGVTQKIAKYHTEVGFKGEQKEVAEQIFRALVKDTEISIRKTLSEAISESDNIPKDVVMSLAKDVKEVAIPVLEFSEVFSDVDLVEIIRSTGDFSKSEAIAKRKTVSEMVSDVLVETGNERVIDRLLHNKGADVSDKGYSKIVSDFSVNDKLMQAVVEREKLPVAVVEILAEKVSDAIYGQLAKKHKSEISKIDAAVRKSREVAAMKVMGMASSEQEYKQFCEMMKKLNISEDIMPVAALCAGNINIFEICIARKTKIPVMNVRTLLEDNANKGFKALYERAALPKHLYAASSALIKVLKDLQDDLKGHGLKLSGKMANRIIENLMMRSEEEGEIESLDYIITLIKHNSVER